MAGGNQEIQKVEKIQENQDSLGAGGNQVIQKKPAFSGFRGEGLRAGSWMPLEIQKIQIIQKVQVASVWGDGIFALGIQEIQKIQYLQDFLDAVRNLENPGNTENSGCRGRGGSES